MNTSKSTIVMALALLSLSSFTQAGEFCTNENLRLMTTTPTSDFYTYQDGTVAHKATKLHWMRCPLGQRWDQATYTCSGSATKMTWGEALNTAAAINNGTSDVDGDGAAGFEGHSDWRVPNITELGSIIERRCHAPSINEKLFPLSETHAVFWSSTSVPETDSARQVIFGDGRYEYDVKSTLANVRLVRDAAL